MTSNIDRIYVETANFKGEERGATAEHFYDNMLANLKFTSGALGNISGICPCDYGYDARVEIVGKKGIMQIGSMQGMDVLVCVDREQGLVTPIYKRWPERFAWGYIYEIQHFIECIQTEQPAKVSGADNPLLALRQVIATPRTGAHTDGATNAMGWGALRDCLAVLRGQAPAHRVV